MTCPRCDTKMIRTPSLDEIVYWCVNCGEYNETREITPENMQHRRAGAKLNRMFIERTGR